MTQNQINYAKLQEERRHNLATEGMSALELQETSRHNISSEGINWYSASEQGRHNQATENINWYTAIKQGNVADSQEFRNYAEGNYTSMRAEMLEKDYSLEKSKFEHQVWKDIKQFGLDEEDVETRKANVENNKRKIDAEIDQLMLNYDLDLAIYGRDAKQKKAQMFRDIASGVKSATDAFLELFDWIWGLKQGLLPGK